MSKSRTIVLIAILTLGAVSAFTQDQGDPTLTEVWEPEPSIIIPGVSSGPPSDAVILFDGTDLSAWQARNGGAPPWEVSDGVLTVLPDTGDIMTKQGFSDVQLHVERRTPAIVTGEGQDRGNSGIYLMSRYELQVLDSYENRTYSNGQAGSIYKQHIPLVNASRAPGAWQTYDIIFMAPRFRADDTVPQPATMTVFHNGVLIQNHVALRGTSVFIGEAEYEAHGSKEPLLLQEHDHPVSYRNIWVREL